MHMCPVAQYVMLWQHLSFRSFHMLQEKQALADSNRAVCCVFSPSHLYHHLRDVSDLRATHRLHLPLP